MSLNKPASSQCSRTIGTNGSSTSCSCSQSVQPATARPGLTHFAQRRVVDVELADLGMHLSTDLLLDTRTPCFCGASWPRKHQPTNSSGCLMPALRKRSYLKRCATSPILVSEADRATPRSRRSPVVEHRRQRQHVRRRVACTSAYS